MEQVIKDHYRSSANLNARVQLHRLYSTNPYGWFRWYMDQLQIPEGSQILELGCGPGYLWKETLEHVRPGWRLTLTDLSVGMAAEAKALIGSAGRFCFAAANAQQLPFPDDSFDTVLANHMLYHVPDLDQALVQIRRVLRPGGVFYASTNGERHMTEMYELEDRLTGRATGGPIPAPRAWAMPFTLENGGGILRRYFTEVRLLRYEDGLEVTQPQPLIEYIRSMLGHINDVDLESRFDQLKRQIEETLRLEGTVRITKDTGLFIAR